LNDSESFVRENSFNMVMDFKPVNMRTWVTWQICGIWQLEEFWVCRRKIT